MQAQTDTEFGDIIQGFLEKYESLKRHGMLEPILRGIDIKTQRPPEIEEIYAMRDAFHALRTFEAFIVADEASKHQHIQELRDAGAVLRAFCVSADRELAKKLTSSEPISQEVRQATSVIDEQLPQKISFYTSRPNRILGNSAAQAYFENSGWLERRARDRLEATDHALKRLAPVFDLFSSVPLTKETSAEAKKLANSLSEYLLKLDTKSSSKDEEYDLNALKSGRSNASMLMLGEYVWGFCAFYLTWRKSRKTTELPVKPEMEEILALRAILMELRHVEAFGRELQIRVKAQDTEETVNRRDWAFMAGVVLRQFIRELINTHREASGFDLDEDGRIRLPGEIPKAVRQAAQLLHLILPRIGYNINRISATDAKKGKQWGAQVAKRYLSEKNIEKRKRDRTDATTRATLGVYTWPPIDFWKQQH